MNMPRKRSLRKNVKNILQKTEETKEIKTDTKKKKSINEVDKNSELPSLIIRNEDLKILPIEQNVTSESKMSDKQITRNIMVTYFKNNIDTIQSASKIKIDNNIALLFNAHQPVVTLKKISSKDSVDISEFRTPDLPKRAKSVSFTENVGSQSTFLKSNEVINKNSRRKSDSNLNSNSISKMSRGNKILKISHSVDNIAAVSSSSSPAKINSEIVSPKVSSLKGSAEDNSLKSSKDISIKTSESICLKSPIEIFLKSPPSANAHNRILNRTPRVIIKNSTLKSPPSVSTKSSTLKSSPSISTKSSTLKSPPSVTGTKSSTLKSSPCISTKNSILKSPSVSTKSSTIKSPASTSTKGSSLKSSTNVAPSTSSTITSSQSSSIKSPANVDSLKSSTNVNLLNSPIKGSIKVNSLKSPVKVSTLKKNSTKEIADVKLINRSSKTEKVNFNIGTTVVQLEMTPRENEKIKVNFDSSSKNVSSLKKSNLSSHSKPKSKKLAVRFGDQVLKDSETLPGTASSKEANGTSDVSITSLNDSASSGMDGFLPMRSPKKPEKTPRKRVQKKTINEKHDSSDEDTIASFISKETKNQDTNVLGNKKARKNANTRVRNPSASKEITSIQKEITPTQKEIIGNIGEQMDRNTTPKKVKKKLALKKLNHKKVLAEQRVQGEDKEKEACSIPEGSVAKKQRARSRPAAGKENKSKSVSKKLEDSQTIEESEDFDRSELNSSNRTDDESITEEGHMPLIAVTSSPAFKKQMKPKIRQEKDIVTPFDGIIKAKSTKGRKRPLDEDAAPKKKRGRKRVKKDSVFLDGNQKGDQTEDDDLDDEDEESLAQKQKQRKKTQRRTGRRFSVTGNWYIASGYLNDVISLLEDFESIKNWRFKDFAVCWREKRFSLVYRGRQTFKELLEFSEEIALLTKRFLGPPHSVKRRIGALYILYGLYYKFPLGKRQFFNLRFELREYEELLNLILPFRSNIENPDPAYIFRKLELEGAILHCATAFEPCYDFHNEERDNVELEYGKERLAKSSAVSNAIPKFQLQADLNLFQHYHSVKAQLVGQAKPEKALTMITPEFLEIISSNLTHLRKNTLEELGMIDEGTRPDLRNLGERSHTETNNSHHSKGNSVDMNSEIELYSVGQNMIDAINNGSTGQRSQKAIENNQLVADQDVKDFMRYPTAQDIREPLSLKGNRSKKSKKGVPSYSMDWNDKIGKNEPEEIYQSEGKVLLDVDENFMDENDKLAEVLLPQPLPHKRKRKPKRPPALLREASYPSKRAKKQELPPVKSLQKEMESFEQEMEKKNDSSVESSAVVSATRLLVSELPEVKPKKVETIMRVRMKSDNVRKIVKLKVSVSPEQFAEIRKTPLRYETFKQNLIPLIRMTQKNDNKDKDWQIEEIFMDKDVSVTTQPVTTETQSTEKESATAVTPLSPKTSIPFKMKYECLKHSEDEDDGEDLEEMDEDLFPCKWKTEEDKDGDYSPPEEGEEEIYDPLEYQDDGIEDYEEDDLIPEPHYFWRRRRRGRRNYYGNFFEERGPRDSDQLLKPRSENSISMIPVRVGDSTKYFPMIKTNDKPNDVKQAPPEEEEVEALPSDPKDAESILTWNDFSSDKSPPFKKRGVTKSFSYIFSPKFPIKKENACQEGEAQLRKISASTVIKPFVKKTVEEPPNNEEVDIHEEKSVKRKGNRAVSRKTKEVQENSEDLVTVKKEMSVLEELAGDWEDDEAVVAVRSTPSKQTRSVNDPLEVDSNYNMTNSDVKDPVNYIPEVKSRHEVFIEDHNVDIVDGTDFQTEIQDEIESELDDHMDVGDDVVNFANNYSADNINMSKEMLPNSYIEGVEGLEEQVPEILPDLPVPSTSFDNNFFLPQGMNDITLSTGSSNSLDLTDLKNSTYFRFQTADGKFAFIPYHSAPQFQQENIQILSFDVADVKPYVPETDSLESSFTNSVYDSSLQQASINNNNNEMPFVHPSTTQQNENIFGSAQLINNQTPVVKNTEYQPQQNYPVVTSTSSSAYECTDTKPSCSFLSTNKNPPLESKIDASRNSTTDEKDNSKVQLNNFSRPACGFLYGPQRKSIGKIASATGIASGKVVAPETPKVKFLMKGGFFKSQRKG